MDVNGFRELQSANVAQDREKFRNVKNSYFKLLCFVSSPLEDCRYCTFKLNPSSFDNGTLICSNQLSNFLAYHEHEKLQLVHPKIKCFHWFLRNEKGMSFLLGFVRKLSLWVLCRGIKSEDNWGQRWHLLGAVCQIRASFASLLGNSKPPTTSIPQTLSIF